MTTTPLLYVHKTTLLNPPWFSMAAGCLCAKKFLLCIITVLRIAANLYLGRPVERFKCAWDGSERCDLEGNVRLMDMGDEDVVDYTFLIDFVGRPLISGLGVYMLLSRPERCSAGSWLQLWCYRSILWLFVASAFADESITCLQELEAARSWELNVLRTRSWSPTQLRLFFAGLLISVTFQAAIANLKLMGLSWNRLAACASVLLATSLIAFFSYFLLFLLLDAVNPAVGSEEAASFEFFIIVGMLVQLLIGPLQSLGMFCAICKAMRDLDWADIRLEVGCLCANAVLTLIGSPLSVVVLAVAVSSHGIRDTTFQLILTLDLSFQILNSLLLGGVLGPKGWSKPIDAFARLGYGLAAKRIAVHGMINPSTERCMVSFPGKYAAEWDSAVSAADEQQMCSLACVFLTDTGSGLRQHVENPERPGECYCKALYGSLPVEAYLSEVDATSVDQKQLAFKTADSNAMGQVLLTKYAHTTRLEWETQKAEGIEEAYRRWQENEGRAPWGCAWFHKWKKNVHQAVRLNQSLHVFYFEGRVGAGKVGWDQLADEEVRNAAVEHGGLGNSQTAEVAYLDKLGLPYVEHDIMDFHSFIQEPVTVPEEI
eukprot:s169_g14.t1